MVRWIDAGTPYAGTYACSGSGKGAGAQVPREIAENRCAACHVRGGLNSFEAPGFKPHPAFFREMIRYGILPPTFDPRTAPCDVYKLDRRYFEQQQPPCLKIF